MKSKDYVLSRLAGAVSEPVRKRTFAGRRQTFQINYNGFIIGKGLTEEDAWINAEAEIKKLPNISNNIQPVI